MTPVSKPLPNLLVFALLSLAAVCTAHAESSARVVETQPSGTATLGRQESFWIRIEYQADERINLWARPYRNGVQLKNAISNASRTYIGSGETLGWFALMEPGDVDEVRIFAGGGKSSREWELARQPVDLRWSDATPSGEPRAQWVTDLLAAEQVSQREDAQRRAMQRSSAASCCSS